MAWHANVVPNEIVVVERNCHVSTWRTCDTDIHGLVEEPDGGKEHQAWRHARRETPGKLRRSCLPHVYPWFRHSQRERSCGVASKSRIAENSTRCKPWLLRRTPARRVPMCAAPRYAPRRS